MELNKAVSITGLWTRCLNNRIQTLIEIDGQWRLVHDEQNHTPDHKDNQALFSIITNPGGIKNSPLDKL